MNDFFPVGRVAEFPDPSSTMVEVDGVAVVLVHTLGRFYALDDVCTHDGGPLSDGRIDQGDGSIACPRHGAKFSVATGEAITMPATKATAVHQVRVEGDVVSVRLNES